MEMIPVVSSNLRAVGYDRATRTLVIEFNGGTYQYSNVPPDIHDELMKAPSKGKFFYQNIRDKFSSEEKL